MERQLPVVCDELQPPASAGLAAVLRSESEEWWQWLDLPTSIAFRYEHPAGGFTARREQRKNRLYWYAYRKRGGVVHKTYLGKTRDLTAACLETAALRLAHRSSEPGPARDPQPTRSPGDPSRMLHNLPAHLPRLIGREQELEAICRALLGVDRGLLTMTGTGGSGKTRLALEVAATLRKQFADGVWFVELAGIGDSALVPMAVATALGLREVPGRSVIESVRRVLRDRVLLLVLDNCEHLVDACARLVDHLLSGCPGLRVLATSREPLRTTGELVWRVDGLAAP